MTNSLAKYTHNRISTAKYNVFTFLYKFLKEQFSKYANVFFLVTAIIQVIILYIFLSGMIRQLFWDILITYHYYKFLSY